jgi:hypothetical protein
MAHENVVAAIETEIREHQRAIEVLRASLREIGNLRPASPVLESGRVKKKPVAWAVADDMQILMEDGQKSWHKEELIRELVVQDLVGGDTEEKKYEAARIAVSFGINKGYLRENPEAVLQWIPGVRINKRIAKRH